MPSSSASFSFRPFVGEVADDKVDPGFLQRAGNADRMQETFLAFGGFRRAGVLRQAIDDGGRDLDGVFHLALGKAGMGGDALDGDGGAVGGKGLVLDIARAFAVHRVGEIGAELFQVRLVDAAADLFVGREQDLDGAVLDLGVVEQELRGIHDLGEPGLVVGAEQRGAVGRDDIVADLVGERRVLGGADDLRGIGRQHDVAAAVVLHDLRLDVLAGAIRRGVHMRAEADHRHLLGGIGRDRRVDIAVLVEMGVGKTHRLEFGGEQAAQVLLLFGRRTGRRGRVGLGVDHDIAQKTLGHAVLECDG